MGTLVPLRAIPPMSQISLFQIDAFTQQLFRGNPAAVCPLNFWLEAEQMQRIAAENNLSETAFCVRRAPQIYELRWFTPTTEVSLCGHATLAAAYVMFRHFESSAPWVVFHTQSGELKVERHGERLQMDFPRHPPTPAAMSDLLVRALGQRPEAFLQAQYGLAVLTSEQAVRDLHPDYEALSSLDHALIVTAPGETCDFVSRFFAPQFGILEDPVTGSAHCTLIPYWANRLRQPQLYALQVSQRGGELYCQDARDRVLISGHAVQYLTGTIDLDVRTKSLDCDN